MLLRNILKILGITHKRPEPRKSDGNENAASAHMKGGISHSCSARPSDFSSPKPVSPLRMENPPPPSSMAFTSVPVPGDILPFDPFIAFGFDGSSPDETITLSNDDDYSFGGNESSEDSGSSDSFAGGGASDDF